MISPVPRLSVTEHTILELLADHEAFGLQLVEQSKGTIKRGTVYVTLARMQEKGYVESRALPLPEGGIGLPRRLYKPTALGFKVLHAWTLAAQAMSSPWPQEA